MKYHHRTTAIKRFCMECMGHDGWRGGNVGTGPTHAIQMVRECSDSGCQLYYFRNGVDERPGKDKKTMSDKTKAALADGRRSLRKQVKSA